MLRNFVSTTLGIGHDSIVGGHFKFAKNLSRLNNYHWRHETRDVKKYFDGCLKCQYYKESSQQKISGP